MAQSGIEESRPWPMRAFLLLALGALAGLVIHWLTDGFQPWNDRPLKLAAAAFTGCGFVAFAFSLERLRWTWSVGFALLVGLVVGLVTWSNGPYGGWGSNEGWQIFSALLAIAIAVPIFQTARDAGRPRLDYPSLHAHSWTNIVLWVATWGFVLVAYLLAQLLAELFNLIGIHVLRDLLRESWFNLMLIGAAFGAAAGLFRDRDAVLGTLQRVVTAILSVLTPFLAIGLVLFVLALPFTGLEPLWSQTKQTTPILLFCILGAFLLVNATVGNAPDEEPRSPLLRHAALGLAAVMLPLGLVASISLGKRIGQYGLTPERLWAAVFVFVAIAAGLLYLGAIARRRLAWPEDVRRANIGLALGVCGLALFLALPLLSFGAISARSQVARLQSGKVAADKFDWIALRFDFGPAGRRLLEQLAHSADSRIRAEAAATLARKARWPDIPVEPARNGPPLLKVVPSGILPDALRQAVLDPPGGLCRESGDCLVYWKPGQTEAIVLMDGCATRIVGKAAQLRPGGCSIATWVLRLRDGQWTELNDRPPAPVVVTPAQEQAMLKAERDAIDRGDVTIREVKRRQIFVGDKPSGGLFE